MREYRINLPDLEVSRSMGIKREGMEQRLLLWLTGYSYAINTLTLDWFKVKEAH
jgi:hypothetical protein